MADYTVVARLDAENKTMQLMVVDSSGVAVATWGSVALTLGKNPGTTPASPFTSMGKQIKLRETKGCDDDGNPQYCMIPRSEWYSTPITSDPTL